MERNHIFIILLLISSGLYAGCQKTLVEKRAGLEDLDDQMTQQQVRSFIMDERAGEFTGEFQRKWDLTVGGN